MAFGELEIAFDRVMEQLPADWMIKSMVQDGGGWHVEVCRIYNGLGGIGARGGNLTKALNRLADRLEQRNGI